MGEKPLGSREAFDMALGWQRGLAALVALGMACQAGSAWAQDGVTALPLRGIGTGDIDALTSQIVSKEVELMKCNTNLRIHQLPTAWTARRWGLANAAGVALTATGAFMNGCGRYSYLHTSRLKKAPKHLFVNAGWCRVTANFIMVGAGILETAVLATKDYRDRKQGVDLPRLRKYADETQNELDSLMAQREASIKAASLTPGQVEVYEAEGRVLKDVRNLAIDEFVRYYADTKGSRAFFYASYIIATLSNALAGAGGITGNVAALKRTGTARWRTRLGGTGGIADIISGSMNQSVPVAIRIAGSIATNRAKKDLCKQLDCREPAALDAFHEHQEQYHKLVASHAELATEAPGASMRDSVYAKTASIFDEREKIRLGDVKARKHRLVSQLIFFTGIGMPKTVNGIGTTVGAFKYTNNTHERFEAIGGPAIAYGAGYSVAFAELMRNQLMNELRAHRAQKEGRSTKQILTRQLNDLDAMIGNFRVPNISLSTNAIEIPKLEVLESDEPDSVE